jgi:hypothetical protein
MKSVVGWRTIRWNPEIEESMPSWRERERERERELNEFGSK